jgi:thioredoxin|tara:strand:+ start:171 stop:611 length:441 start_codon:yes stop_codon:yes gene_type:complete
MENCVEYLKSKQDLEDTSHSNIVLDFTASWCGPCQVIGPEFEKFSKEEIFQHVKFYKVDVDDNEELCEAYDINCMPTFIFLKNKKQVDLLSGASVQVLREKIESNFCEINSSENNSDSDEKEQEKEIELEHKVKDSNTEVSSLGGL